MLSILIPTYNYNIFPLVEELHRQCNECGIAFEIITLDDGSGSLLNTQNNRINNLSNSSFTELPQNIGRSAIRNLLAEKALYNWLLFLDADTFPSDGNLVRNYLPSLNADEKVVYGGILYQQERPATGEVLRWVYGNSREALPVEERANLPYTRLLTLNFLIAKSVFSKVKFNEGIPNLRHEDTLFSYNLQQAQITVEHINNPVIHHGLESSEIFLRKSEESLEGLKYLMENKLIDTDYTSIGKMFLKLKRMGTGPLAAGFFRLFKKPMRKNLTGSQPSLLIFDLYRLGYLCNIR